MKNKKRNGNKNKKENLDERPIDGDLFCLTNTTNYYKFLKVALNYADTICLTFNGRYKEFIELDRNSLAESLKGHKITNQTAVTIGPTVCLLYFRIDSNMRKWLDRKRHIYDFYSDEEWLEDLCLLKDEQVIFASCTHEEFCYVDKKLADMLGKMIDS